MNARYLATQAIAPLLRNSGSLKYSLKKFLVDCPDNQKPLMQELCYGSMRHYPKLDCIIKELTQKPLKTKDSDIRALLLIGLYQLTNLSIPDHAAISETVDVCDQLKKTWAKPLLNACLRNFLRSRDSLATKLDSQKQFKFNHPEWFIEKLKHNWPDDWQQILSANDDHPPLTLRVNTKIVSRETLLLRLKENDIDARTTESSEYGITLTKPTDITQIEGFTAGEFSVQDEAAQLAASLVAPKAGELILDACSAPGGKLLHLMELSDCKETEIQGLELEEHRAARILENFERLNLRCELHIADATKSDWWDSRLYDKILLDAPCSATGVIRRNPDIKLLRTQEDIHETAKLQKVILDNMWDKLKVGGQLVYATCSIFAQENENQVRSFLKRHSDAEHEAIEANWGREREFGRQLFPQTNGHDGFYYAILKKTH